MSLTIDELRRMRRAGDRIAAQCGCYTTVTKEQRLSKQGESEYLQTEWQVFAFRTPQRVEFMAFSRVSEADCLVMFQQSYEDYVESLKVNASKAQEALSWTNVRS